MIRGVINMINSIKNIKSADYMKSIMILSFMLILLLPSNVVALKMLSGDQVSVDSPIQDDIFAAGGTIDINAPVDGVVIAGGIININAPVNGDVFVAGGQIFVNSEVKGKIVAAGGNIDIKGNAKNIVIAGGNITIHSTAVISRDAIISGGNVNNAGTVNGNLTVRAQNFQNTGSAGSVDFIKSEGSHRTSGIFPILITLGFLILGIILLKLFPVQFSKVEKEIRESTLFKTVIGFVLIIVSVVVIILAAVTVIGLPVAAIMAMLFIIALMLTTIFVSFPAGKKILGYFKLKTSDTWIFVVGFIILSLLFRIPYVGGLIQIVAISLGFGAVYFALREAWKGITHREVSEKTG